MTTCHVTELRPGDLFILGTHDINRTDAGWSGPWIFIRIAESFFSVDEKCYQVVAVHSNGPRQVSVWDIEDVTVLLRFEDTQDIKPW